MTIAHLLSLDDSLDLFVGSDSGASDTLVTLGLIPALPITIGQRPVLVWGWSLVRRAADLGIAELETRSVDLDPAAALKVALKLENRVGHFSWAEQDAIVTFLEQIEHERRAGVSSVAADRLAISRLVRGDGALFELTGRYRKLEHHLRPLVDRGVISLKTAERIRQVPPEFLQTNLTRVGAMSFSTRRQFLELLAELIRDPSERPVASSRPSNGRALRSASGTTERSDESGILGDGASGGLLQRAALALQDQDPVSTLRRLRFPVLTALEDRFSQIQDGALGGTGVKLAAPAYFEGGSYSVSFSFTNCEELQQRIRDLNHLKGYCEELFDLL